MAIPCSGFWFALVAGLGLLAGNPAGAQGEPGADDLDESGSIVGYITTRIPIYGVGAGPLAAEPERFAGQVLSVPGQIVAVHSEHVFTIRDSDSKGGPEVVVISRLPAQALKRGKPVQVVGQLRPLVLEDFERDYDWFDRSWLGKAGSSLDLRPALVAASVVALEDERELLQGLDSD